MAERRRIEEEASAAKKGTRPVEQNSDSSSDSDSSSSSDSDDASASKKKKKKKKKEASKPVFSKVQCKKMNPKKMKELLKELGESTQGNKKQLLKRLLPFASS